MFSGTVATGDFTQSWYQQIQERESQYGHSRRKQSERLTQWPGVLQLRDAEELSIFACSVVLTGEARPAFAVADALSNDELMWQIQLTADGIRSRAVAAEAISEGLE